MTSYHARRKAGSQPSTPFFDLFNVQNQILLLFISNSLYLIITILLFQYMRLKRKGLQLRWILLGYDAINVLLAAYIVTATLRFKLGQGGGMLLCNPISHQQESLDIIPVFILFYFQKFIEFFDTWFFILRKSARQVTFLHLFHHASITIVVGFILPFDYNGDMYLPILLNSFNHMTVYLHYLLATLGIKSPWANYITSMQFIQFVVIFLQSLVSYKIGPTCGSPDFAKLLMIVYMGSMVALFVRYFIQKYIFRRPNSSLDMCGVIKMPSALDSSSLAKTVQHCGVARLDERGECHIALPDSFPDPSLQLNPVTSSKRFTFVYHMTPLHEPMPDLYISAEVHRWKQPQVQSATTASSSSSSSSGSAKQSVTNGAYAEVCAPSSRKSSGIRLKSADNLIPTEDKKLSMGGAIAKSKSYNSFASFRHNDRLIDGPLPSLFERSPSSKRSSTADASTVLPPSSSANGASGLLRAIGAQEEIEGRHQRAGGRISPQPLCFSISGGRPKGRVSWMVMTVPGEETDEGVNMLDPAADWRAIIT